MSNRWNFTKHAFQRLGERTSHTVKSWLELFECGKFINLGAKPGLLREHLLFWSKEDQAAYIAIRDVLDGSIITVLPLEYHEVLAWKITEEQIKLARELVQPPNQSAEKFSLSVSVLVDGRVKVRDLGRFPISLLSEIDTEPFKRDLRQILSAQGFDTTNGFYSVKIGRNGQLQQYTL